LRWERLLSAWLEAGGAEAAFWRATPRTTLLTIDAYRRRRGWLAWNIAALGRFEFEHGFPTLESLMGVAERQSDEHRRVMLAHNLRLWRSVLNREEAAGAA
jgi:hypothetical protein